MRGHSRQEGRWRISNQGNNDRRQKGGEEGTPRMAKGRIHREKDMPEDFGGGKGKTRHVNEKERGK